MSERDDGYEVVRAAVARSFQLSPDEVTGAKSLVNDLGADSLDFVDLLFTLEESFGIEFSDSGSTFLSQLDITNPEVVVEGVLTEGALETLRELLPGLDELHAAGPVTPAQLYALITVDTLWVMVKRAQGVD